MKKLAFLVSAFSIMLSYSCQQQNQFLPEPVEDRSEQDEVTILNYLEENNLMADAQRHETGVYYVIEEEGEGSEFPTPNSQILVNYIGYLTDGTVFDESEEGDARQFNLGNTITGWRIGVPLIKKGGKIQFFIPSNLGYAQQEQEDIPAYSVLIFEVELVNFL
ncbi:MAG: FKBP-type peptidyl-prolyl cis-trans isomerase [Phaeodactylibacter sp.]|nr:FKBP-type peptidyl-prolyl cis-trans isomerase [Phaeodactylibacter sp.]